ncbi:MAG: hypothetical protein JRJ38_17580 [Deltaproteobacteria bacterium]|nr:hypothetical protein [Deltaproteobacteria bacterium]
METDINENILMIEYQMCHDGYNSRDQITQDEFSKLVQTFSIFFTVLFAINIFVKVNPFLHILIIVIIGIAGLLSMMALFLDIQSSSSCKVALRERCIEIEKTISKEKILCYWDKVEKRSRYPEERFFKRIMSPIAGRRESQVDIFINASRALILLWIFILFAVIIWGNSIEFSQI